MVFLGAFFAIVINTVVGVRNLDPALVKAARSFGASDAQIFRTLALPGTVPFILAGFRLGLGHALIGRGRGRADRCPGRRRADDGEGRGDLPDLAVFAGLVIIAITGVVITFAFSQVEKRFQSWKPNPT